MKNMKSFRKHIREDVYSLYSMNIPADLSEQELQPYFEELMNTIIIESREKNLIVKVKTNNEITDE